MLTNPFQQISRRGAGEYAHGFVRGVAIDRHPARNRRIERLLRLCWVLIAAKCAIVAWAVGRYHVPFSALWVIAPTLVFAAVVTAVYWWRD